MADVDLTEKISNLGYCAIKVEAAKGTAVIPDIFAALFNESIITNVNFDEDLSMRGIRDELYGHFRGGKDHQGEIEVLAEPVTAAHFINMLLKKGATTGDAATGYIHPFTLGVSATLPKSYTLEILKGNIPFRYFGVEAKSIKPTFVDNKMHLNVAVSARGQFSVARLASASGTAVVLSTEHTDSPTNGLVVGDKIRLYDVSGGTYEDVTITVIDADGITLTVTETIAGTYIAGDFCYLKPLTPGYSLLAPFSWGATEFCFGVDAATALAATHTPLEKGSDFEIIHVVHNDPGSKRSGSFETSHIIRTTGRVNLTIKKAFTDGQKYHNFLHRIKEAIVVRCFSRKTIGTDDGVDAELRVTINNPRVVLNPVPLAIGELIMMEQELVSVYDTSDTQGFDVKVINEDDGTAM